MKFRFKHHSLTLESSIGAITEATAWLREQATQHGLGDEVLFQLELCAEELVTNVVTHSHGGRVGEFRLDLLLDQDSATVTLIDDGPAFDPSGQAEPASPASLESAAVGGLGIHLVRQFAESMRYERHGNRNRFTFRVGSGLLAMRHGERRHDKATGFPLVRRDGTRVATSTRSGVDRRVAGFVASSALFQGVPFKKVERIIAHCEVRAFGAREVLFHAGEYHRCVLVVIEGGIAIHLEGPGSKFFVDLGPGECVGEMSVADGRCNSAWVVGGSAGRVLVIPEPVFLEEVLAVPRIARNVIVMMSDRMRRSTQQVVAHLRAEHELESLQRELEIARQIQESMLPASPHFEIRDGIAGRGFMRTARPVGGDFYDAFPLGDGRYFLAIGDVCGKGTPAALFMVRTLTVLRSEALRCGVGDAQTLAMLAARVNDQLCMGNAAEQFVTLFCAILDAKAERLDYVNLGHNPPVLRLPGERAGFMAQPTNPLAGLFEGLRFVAGTTPFPAGSLLMLYTDGVTEAEAQDGRQFGDDALLGLLGEPDDQGAEACVQRVVEAVDAFAAGFMQADDITLLAIRH